MLALLGGLIAAVVALVVVALARAGGGGGRVTAALRGARRIRLHLEDRGFVCSLNLDGQRSLVFLLDTGFAGAPILNRRRQASAPAGCASSGDPLSLSFASLGRVEGHTAEPLACPVHLHRGEAHPRPFLLMDLDRETPHILTIDFLLSFGGGALLELGGRSPRVTVGAPAPPPGSVAVPTRRIHGAYAIRLALEGPAGAAGEGWFVVDTGSPAPLTVGKSFGEGLGLPGGHQAPGERFVKQVGVNRETICSLVSPRVTARAAPGIEMETPLLLNDVDTPGGSDGYIGLGMLTQWRGLAFCRRGDDEEVTVHIDAPVGGTPLRASTRLIDDAMVSSCGG